MTAYLLLDIEIHDPEGFQTYRTRASEFIAKHGGEYVVRGGEFEVIEGDWKPNRLVIFKFPNRQAIRNFFADPDYAEVAAIRFKTSKTIAIAVDGVA